MAPVRISVASPGEYNPNNCDLSASECSNCTSLAEQLRSALGEIESARLIVQLLQKERTEDPCEDEKINEPKNSPSNASDIVYSSRLKHDNWTVQTAKYHRRGFSSKNFTEANNIYALPTANRYEKLLNLQDPLTQGTVLQSQGDTNTTDTPTCNLKKKTATPKQGKDPMRNEE
jgi:hypothetical protein